MTTHNDGVEARQKEAARQFGTSLGKKVSGKLVAARAPFSVNYGFLCGKRQDGTKHGIKYLIGKKEISDRGTSKQVKGKAREKG